MSVWFVSRHPGAIAWAKNQNLGINHWRTHLAIDEVASGDTVIGTLPVHLAAEVCARKARFFALSMELSVDQRGRELSCETMQTMNCSLQEFVVTARS